MAIPARQTTNEPILKKHIDQNKRLKHQKVGLDTSYVGGHNDDQSKNIWCLIFAHIIKGMTVILKRQLKSGGRLLKMRNEYREVNYLVALSRKLCGDSAVKDESGSGHDLARPHRYRWYNIQGHCMDRAQKKQG